MPKLTPGDIAASESGVEGPGAGSRNDDAPSGWTGIGKAPAGTLVFMTISLNATATVPSAGFAECWARARYVVSGGAGANLGSVYATQSGAGSDNDNISGTFSADISGQPLTGGLARANIEWNVAGAGNTANMTATITDWWVVIPVPGIMEA